MQNLFWFDFQHFSTSAVHITWPTWCGPFSSSGDGGSVSLNSVAGVGLRRRILANKKKGKVVFCRWFSHNQTACISTKNECMRLISKYVTVVKLSTIFYSVMWFLMSCLQRITSDRYSYHYVIASKWLLSSCSWKGFHIHFVIDGGWITSDPISKAVCSDFFFSVLSLCSSFLFFVWLLFLLWNVLVQ